MRMRFDGFDGCMRFSNVLQIERRLFRSILGAANLVSEYVAMPGDDGGDLEIMRFCFVMHCL
ncbi:protein of unknown function [Burkholderia multivorans]